MNTNDALANVWRRQAEILETAAGVMALIDSDPAVGQAELVKARWQLARQVREYQLFKHAEIFGPTIRFGTETQSRLAAQAAALCTANGAEFHAYLTQWSGRDTLGQWPDYQSATKAMVAGLRQALAAEKFQIGRLVEGAERTRQPRR